MVKQRDKEYIVEGIVFFLIASCILVLVKVLGMFKWFIELDFQDYMGPLMWAIGLPFFLVELGIVGGIIIWLYVLSIKSFLNYYKKPIMEDEEK